MRQTCIWYPSFISHVCLAKNSNSLFVKIDEEGKKGKRKGTE
jgi:hypothetical protein